MRRFSYDYHLILTGDLHTFFMKHYRDIFLQVRTASSAVERRITVAIPGRIPIHDARGHNEYDNENHFRVVLIVAS